MTDQKLPSDITHQIIETGDEIFNLLKQRMTQYCKKQNLVDIEVSLMQTFFFGAFSHLIIKFLHCHKVGFKRRKEILDVVTTLLYEHFENTEEAYRKHIGDDT